MTAADDGNDKTAASLQRLSEKAFCVNATKLVMDENVVLPSV